MGEKSESWTARRLSAFTKIRSARLVYRKEEIRYSSFSQVKDPKSGAGTSDLVLEVRLFAEKLAEKAPREAEVVRLVAFEGNTIREAARAVRLNYDQARRVMLALRERVKEYLDP